MRISKDQQIADMKRDRARRDIEVEIAAYQRVLDDHLHWTDLHKLINDAKARLKAHG